jgi:serine protease Do
MLFQILFLLFSFFIFANLNQSFAQEVNKLEINKTENKFNNLEEVPNKSQLIPSFADLIENLLPSVVNISATQGSKNQNSIVLDSNMLGNFPPTPIFEELKKQLDKQIIDKKKIISIGSGFLISKDGYIATNYHVIEDALEISIGLQDKTFYKANLVAFDRKSDLALLKINPTKELKFARFGDSSRVKIGDWLIAIGNPYGFGSSVSLGILSARGRDVSSSQSDEYLQTDTSINKGNSGGPLFNSKGEVVGISTSIFSPSGGNVGIAFATPSNNAFQILKQLKEQGEVVRGWIGVMAQDLNQDLANSIKLNTLKGAFVSDITKNGPADKAGIIPSDVILQFDEHEITDVKTLPKVVNKLPIGKIVKVLIFRYGKTQTVNLIIEKTPKEEAKKTTTKPIAKTIGKLLGISFAEEKITNKTNIDNYLVVSAVDPRYDAYYKGIAVGDIVVSVNQQIVTNFAQMQKIIKTAQTREKNITFLIKKENNLLPITISLLN